MSFVIDASIAIAWGMPDENSDAADAAFHSIQKSGAYAPVLFVSEVVNAVLIAQTRGRIEGKAVSDLLEQFRNLPIFYDHEIEEVIWGVVFELSTRNSLTVYDASYLELAMRKKLPLATLDGKLAKACVAEGVAVLGQDE